ncbi:MAG: DUF951 domain-containing protein [Ardenticatenia bacterium]|uniref:DUF951 domain-containing protein n=1 Tax=Ardenticatena maritima TaxID=872965 RepID=A0A0M9UCX7_9CHLR|nr:DUF951 domain-containing protein [Ardenticatena maritima]KPL89577.1 hypothetical protein SE16_03940 [Ardenticatena maritima]RME09267.1 MAG: DUF951 domain-containing protein [Ardenticatenia bacterium]GAP63347.1 hypothetical protein ARMA_1770 [Ardenticatena maritima]
MRTVQVHLDDRVEMRKPHPCGGRTWRIVRVGADIGMVCETCGRRVLIPRDVFNKRVKRVLPSQDETATGGVS